MLEKILETPLHSKIKSVNPKRNQPWIFIGRKDAEAEAGHLLWRVDSLEKILMLGKIKGKRRKGQQRLRWWVAYWFSGYEFEQTPGDGEGQRSLTYFSPWGFKESDMTEQRNNRNNKLCGETKVFYSLFAGTEIFLLIEKWKSKPQWSPHNSENGHHREDYKWIILERVWRKGNPAGGNVNWCSQYAK